MILSASRRAAMTMRGRAMALSRRRITHVRIGDVSMALKKQEQDEKGWIPEGYAARYDYSDSFLGHLKWILAKDKIGQDSLLIGPPGSVYRRHIALAYAEITQQPVEYVALHADLTADADLKQRREIRSGGSIVFDDQAPVRAAKYGRMLVLDGLEQAERNVLPTLNNLLEHREMQLEDGTFLISPERFRQLRNDRVDMSRSNLIPVHENFRVLALGVPAPPFPGRSLDPPLRSRFQIRRVDAIVPGILYEHMVQTGTPEEIARLCSTLSGSMEESLLKAEDDADIVSPLPFTSLPSVVKSMVNFPGQAPSSFLERAYPLSSSDERFNSHLSHSQRHSKNMFWKSFKAAARGQTSNESTTYKISKIEKVGVDKETARVVFDSSSQQVFFKTNEQKEFFVRCGSGDVGQSSVSFVETETTHYVIAAMMQEHAADSDILLLSPKGDGKNVIAQHFANQLGYDTRLFILHREVTASELLMRRASDQETGNTTWEPSPLLQAAQNGEICILDGVEQLRPDTLATLQRLAIDRECSLPDGRVITKGGGGEHIMRAHPSFRIIALGTFSSDLRTSWLDPTVQSMFKTIVIPESTDESLFSILRAANPSCPSSTIDKLIRLKSMLTQDVAKDCGVAPLSIRNLTRVSRNVTNEASQYEALCAVLLADLLAPAQRANLETIMRKASIKQGNQKVGISNGTISLEDDSVKIGDFVTDRQQALHPELVPSPRFFDVPNHVSIIKNVLKDWSRGERALLLIGGQGVGKNALIDRICELKNFEREYIQLHRDSTMGQLTLTPTLEDGKISWDDSPLVRAVEHGRILVVDEADKAPVAVVAVLKSLVEDGELLLADGRIISKHRSGTGIIPIHKNFGMFILANRPGFPFLGNDFLGEIGDCFSVRVIPNPDIESEVELLQSYAPSVSPELIRRIAGSFAELRIKNADGHISYPYSAREAIAVCKHLESYPEHDIVETLHNVLSFDSFNKQTYSVLAQVFKRHGFPLSSFSWTEIDGGKESNEAGRKLRVEYFGQRIGAEGTSSNPPSLEMPKHGKWDDNNEAHVGGNQWAGGTGGSNTTGLGGRGGPYRLDRGHKVHQVSDEAKAQVSEEAARAAREMAQQALKEKLQAIGMSSNEYDLYQRFAASIKADVDNLRGLLSSVTLKSSERGWIKRQTQGEIDDSKLIDGISGEKHIYKKRGEIKDGLRQKPTKLRIVADVSGSMYRFNGYDERLQRCLETTLLIMESFKGLNDRFEYSIVGHSGDSECIPLTDPKNPPSNELEMMRVLQTMLAHSQYCQSGDHTLEAMDKAILDISEHNKNDETGDEAIVIGVSDANLARYGIHPRELGAVMQSGQSRGVQSHCIFIATLGEEASIIKQSLPFGRGHVCFQTSEVPRTVKNILASQFR